MRQPPPRDIGASIGIDGLTAALRAATKFLRPGDALLVDGALTYREGKVFVAVTDPIGTVWAKVVKLPAGGGSPLPR